MKTFLKCLITAFLSAMAAYLLPIPSRLWGAILTPLIFLGYLFLATLFFRLFYSRLQKRLLRKQAQAVSADRPLQVLNIQKEYYRLGSSGIKLLYSLCSTVGWVMYFAFFF